ncbi:RNA-guided endonuclease TnpB family protein [Chroococcidiopsis sp. TS-821]|uniref:RNA-guided endonuclease InsQ/TnpB family protein n=1 Tax=Chroococcidiopsis sp. TS-821 TaxID=1378066 RepID=UPI000CEDF921|nr:RNA-guided endonuclease TnpB family protein [Chroococcidiopsis sp. TS-821]PPS43491.1 transposase [Chroococcidiopsis sp. TS-821]
MIVLEFKLKGYKHQLQAIDNAVRTVQFIRNKCIRLWMDSKGVGKKDIYAYTTTLRKEFKYVEALNSTACQQAGERAWSSIAKFYDNCKKKVKGKKGYPKFKKNVRSVEYKQSGWKLSENRKRITFTDKNGIGTLTLKGGWDLNFYPIDQIKRVKIVRRADGYYAQFSINVDVRKYVKQLEPTQECVGIDVGLKYFYADSKGNTVDIPQYYRQAEKQLNRANRKKSKKFRRGQKQSNNYLKARDRYARKHLRVSRQRKGFVQTEALRVIQSNDLVAYEDLKVKNMVRSKLAKTINDASWSAFRSWLEYFGWKYGKVTVAVPPQNTSQNCSNCGKKVNKSLSTRTHKCSHCGYEVDRDINAAINILQLGLRTVGHTGTYAWGVLPSWAVGESLLSNGEVLNQESSRL